MEWAITTQNRVPVALRLSVVVTLAMLLIAWQKNSAYALLLAIPFSFITYLLYFSFGNAEVAQRLRQWCDGSVWRYLIVPLALVALLFLYLLLAGADPWQGNSWQIPLLFCAPVLFYRWAVGSAAPITWKDAIGVLLAILPFILHDYPFDSHLPYGGGGIESLYLTLAIVLAVYALVVVRQGQRVGFDPFFSLAAVKISLKWWALFFTLVVAIGLPGGLLKWSGYEPVTPALLIGGLALFLRTLFGTALPEELVFRGIVMNLLQQRLEQTGNWRRYLYAGLLLLPLAALVGYYSEEKVQWFPLLCATLLGGLTFWLTRRDPAQAPAYTVLFIVGTLFGLAHYHIHSNLFMGLAMVAGWVYGHVYQKTGSVFYSALSHTMVNVTPGLFGLTLVR